ncbi:hypothetical protein, partial [Eikenella halliae]|uniref:hypothetical protein n=1 Tax=Eikenella halliae TaxID=1795832 RepID=UPI0036118322
SYILILSRSVVQFSQRNKDKIRTIKMDWLLIFELFLYTVPVLILLIHYISTRNEIKNGKRNQSVCRFVSHPAKAALY